MARSAGYLNVDAAMATITPNQWDELLAADKLDPSGERRADMRTAYLAAILMRCNGVKDISMWDVLAEMDHAFAGRREDDYTREVKPDEFARIGTRGF